MGCEDIKTTKDTAKGDCKKEECKYGEHWCSEASRWKLCIDYSQKWKENIKDVFEEYEPWFLDDGFWMPNE